MLNYQRVFPFFWAHGTTQLIQLEDVLFHQAWDLRPAVSLRYRVAGKEIPMAGVNMVRPTISVPFLLEMVEIIWSSNFLEIFEVFTWSWRKLRKLTQLRPFDLPLHGTSWNPSGCLDLRGRNLIFIFEFKLHQLHLFCGPNLVLARLEKVFGTTSLAAISPLLSSKDGFLLGGGDCVNHWTWQIYCSIYKYSTIFQIDYEYMLNIQFI